MSQSPTATRQHGNTVFVLPPRRGRLVLLLRSRVQEWGLGEERERCRLAHCARCDRARIPRTTEYFVPLQIHTTRYAGGWRGLGLGMTLILLFDERRVRFRGRSEIDPQPRDSKGFACVRRGNSEDGRAGSSGPKPEPGRPRPTTPRACGLPILW